MLAQLPLLDPSECAQAWASLEALEKYWTPRHDFLPSFTLGAAAYLDVPRHGVPTYVVRGVRNNRLLRRDFGWLLERVIGALEDHLGDPVVVTRRFAVPGFHVFRHHPRMHELKPRIHFDLQGFLLDFEPEDAADPDKRFSFTMAITMPKAGAGLHVWPRDLDQVPNRSDQALKVLSEEVEPEYHAYSLGELFMHDGSHLHAIAADRSVEPGEVRATFQGHGQFTGGAWQLYW